MDVVYTNFDDFFSDYYLDAYRLAFLICKNLNAARSIVFQALLTLAAAAPATPQKDRALFFTAVLDECDRYYLRKPHRAPKRKQLQLHTPFPLTDALWLALKKPYLQKAAVYLRDTLQYTPREIAGMLHVREKTAERALRAPQIDLGCADAITLEDSQAQELLDSVYMRFAERNVPFELKLRRLKRRLDHIVLYVAAAIILLCVAAVIYTANLPVT